MKGLVRALAIASLFVGCGGDGGGCSIEQEALIVLFVPAFGSYTCTADPQSDVSLQRGALDLAYETGYTLPVLLHNNLISRSSMGTNNQVEDGELQLRDVDIVLSMPDAPEVIRQVEGEDPSFVSFTAVLPANSLPPDSTTGVLVDVISSQAAPVFAQAFADNLEPVDHPILVVTLVFHATRTGNSRGSLGVIDSREYTFPIELCQACIGVVCSSCPDEVCPAGSAVSGVCGNAQDLPLYPVSCGPPD